MKITWVNIHSAGKSGVGYNWVQLRLLGVGWPPPKGWLSRLIGVECPDETWELVLKLRGVRTKEERRIILDKYGVDMAKLAQGKMLIP